MYNLPRYQDRSNAELYQRFLDSISKDPNGIEWQVYVSERLAGEYDCTLTDDQLIFNNNGYGYDRFMQQFAYRIGYDTKPYCNVFRMIREEYDHMVSIKSILDYLAKDGYQIAPFYFDGNIYLSTKHDYTQFILIYG